MTDRSIHLRDDGNCRFALNLVLGLSTVLFQSFEELWIVSNDPMLINRSICFEGCVQTDVDVFEDMRIKLFVALPRTPDCSVAVLRGP